MSESVLTVNIVTPDGTVYNHHAEMVVVETLDGSLGILPKHMSIIVPLEIAPVRIKRTENNVEDEIAVNGGFMEVNDNLCTIVADSAEREGDIDLERAERAKLRAEDHIKKAKSSEDIDSLNRAEIALHRAINRINVSKHHF